MGKRVGVVGTGLMGSAIAERLLSAGFDVVVHDRIREKAEPLLRRGAFWSDHPFRDCERLVLCLYTTDDVAAVLDTHGLSIRPGSIVIDTTTGEPDQVARLASELSQRGVKYVDAPISGSSEQTRLGEVLTMVGGEKSTFEACQDILDAFSARTIYAGPAGSGSKMKLVSNLVLGLNRAALAEGLAFAKSIDVDPRAAFEVLRHSMAYSKIMDTKGEKMLAGDLQAAARLTQHLKDIQMILEAAKLRGRRLPLSEVHAQLLVECDQLGFGDCDNSAVLRAYFPSARPNENPLEKANE
jgi:3-hydroxyisobutyrate dehydrogenase-like beta-hydroxyacid dehydrogenase